MSVAKWGRNAKGRAETRPRAIKYYTLSFKPGELKGYSYKRPVVLSLKTISQSIASSHFSSAL